jgi:hypothetical protein
MLCISQLSSDSDGEPVPGSIDAVLVQTGNDGRSWTGLDSDTASAAPLAIPEAHCKKCPLLTDCFGSELSHPLWELPRISARRFRDLSAFSLEVAEVPGDGLTAAQRRHWECVVAGGPRVDGPALEAELSAIQLPVYYLDFEAGLSPKP